MKSPLYLILSVFLLTSCVIEGQNKFKLKEMGTLPGRVNESSGLAIAGDHSMWTHNDGKKAEFYEVDIHGDLLRTVKIQGVDPIDIEELGQDEGGTLYFADTGNNEQERSSLKIYIVEPKEIEVGQVVANTIEFTLPDNGLMSKCHYDFEAMVVSQGLIYLFSKDRCDKKDNSLKYYTVPAEAGTYEAEFMGDFFWEDPDRVIRVTSADISTDGKKLVLLSNNALHFFMAYRKNDFFDGIYAYFELDKSQKEAVVHLNDCDLYITEEAKKNEPAHVYKLNLCGLKFD